MSRFTKLSSSTKSLFSATIFVLALAFSGCTADAIVGPEQSDGPTINTSANPHDSEPGNDDCSVGGC